ncbi:response regulator [Gloeothece verrucosa]|uniref:Protein PatA n=1 Tax=Gloeothece verrucosa (strain PCC 7822) TaxID=497965 RepID=E0UAZ6_GLOV7|nr:response regulator [Gloeothece verrucosa]ADN15118.1 response regulator receiver protein [Gloeothece verrucosa PCC 7822]
MIKVTPKLLTQLTEAFDKLSQQKATGELVLNQSQKVATIYLFSGRLLYVVDEIHRVRRWKRALKQHCPDWTPPTQLSNNDPWEYDLLYQGISQKKLSLNQVKNIICTIAQECLSELVLSKDLHSKWSATQREKSTLVYCITLSLAEIHPVLTHATEIYHQWQAANLESIHPSLSPQLMSTVQGKPLPVPAQYLNGKYTLWDIALELKQPVTEISKLLLSLKDEGRIIFQKIEDLPNLLTKASLSNKPSISQPSTPSPAKASNNNYLIACIDDSPVVAHNLKKILQPAGYQTLSIQEPMAGFAQLIEHKPNLILLDLNMPNANGYSVCKFLRETPVFGKTPIIILTAQDTVIDRARAKLVGATDFISKPPNPEELLQIVQKYLAQASKTEEATYGNLTNQPAY